MKNTNQRIFYISDNNLKSKPNKLETTKHNDLVVEGQKFIDFQEPIDKPVNPLYGQTNSNFFKQIEQQDLIEFPEDMNSNQMNFDINNQNNIIRQPNLFYDNIKSKYFNNLNFPLQQRNEGFTSQNTLMKPQINAIKQLQMNKIEDQVNINQLNENIKQSNSPTKTNKSKPSFTNNCYEGNLYDFNKINSNIQPIYPNLEPVNKNFREDVKSKQYSLLKDNLKNNLTSIQTNSTEGIGIKTKNSFKREESPLNGNEYVINNTNNDLEFLNTLLKLKPSMDENIAFMKNDESRSYTREIIGSDNRDITPGREYGDLFFNENISLISHNKSASYLLNNISNNQGEFIQNTKNTKKHGKNNINNVLSNRSNIPGENNTPIQYSNTTKLNKNDLIEITNKRRNLINNSDISSVEGHFRRRHNEALARIEKLRKEKIEKENSEIKAHPSINKKSKELVERLINKSKPNHACALSKDRHHNLHNLSGNNVNNNVKIFNYNYDPNDQYSAFNNNCLNDLENKKNYNENKYVNDQDKGKHVNNINLYIGRSILPNSLNNLNILRENSKKRNRSTENLKKANTNSSYDVYKKEDFVIETNRIQILNQDKNNRPKIEDYDKLVMLSELVNLGTKSKKNTDKILPGQNNDNVMIADQENKISFAHNYGHLEKEFAFSYDSNKIHNNLQNINQMDDINCKVYNHCEIDLFDDNQNEKEENRCVQYRNDHPNTNSYNLKESGCSNIKSSQQLYPVLDRNLEFKIESNEYKDPLSSKNNYDPNETNEINANFIDRNKSITNKSIFNNVKYDEQISSNFSMNFSKFSLVPKQQKNVAQNNQEIINKSLKHQVSANDFNEMTNKNMVNSYISNQFHFDNLTKNTEISCMTNRKEENNLHNYNRNINYANNYEQNNQKEVFKETKNVKENTDKNIYAAEIDLFDDQEEIKIEDNENETDNYKDNYELIQDNNDIKEVKNKINYFESENDLNESPNHDKNSCNSNLHENNYVNNKLEEKDLIKKNQEHLSHENKLLKKTFINKNNDDLIIPNYLNKLVGEKNKKSLNNTEINSSSLLKSTSTLKVSQLKSEKKQILSKSVNKTFKRTSSVGCISPQKRSDSVPDETNNKTRNGDRSKSINAEKSFPTTIYKSSINTQKAVNNIQKTSKTVNIKKVTNKIDKNKNKSKKLSSSKQEKVGINNNSKITKLTCNMKPNSKNMSSNKSKFIGNNKNITLCSKNENNNKIIREEEDVELEENSEENNINPNKEEEVPLEKDKSKDRYNFINLNNDVLTNTGKNKITSIKYEYNEILNLHRQKQKQSVAEIQKKVDHIIKTQEQVENTIKHDFKSMNIDESSIMRDSNAFKKESDENKLN